MARSFRDHVRSRGWVCALALSVALAIPAMAQPAPASTTDPVAQEFPGQYFPANLPSPEIARFYPQSWTTYAAAPGRNAVFDVAADAPAVLREGVHWAFAGAGAVPLDGPPLGGDFKTTAYTVGMPVGVSVVAGLLYVGDDNGYTYALNALTGKLVWRITAGT